MTLRLEWLSMMIAVSVLSAPVYSAATADFVNGSAAVSERTARGEIKITAKTTSIAAYPFKNGFRWGGEDAAVPRTLIRSLSVSSGAAEIFVPLSAYSDLGNPQKVSLKQNPVGFEVVVIGGDAGTSYKAVLSFEKGWLTHRHVSHGEFPDQAWEETKYAYNKLDD